ncbi:hypothetical protein GH714_021440 [Hevea brasiliensis]|uniref:non-specific serine/threonine protein kinase n=1 Tax=Hevea brasiliensis TaxID=3981 RepID=A0A6A6LNQ2_HEVBR|nr:hypothetical protein GH714_021440 [Hevea brasiliensis]
MDKLHFRSLKVFQSLCLRTASKGNWGFHQQQPNWCGGCGQVFRGKLPGAKVVAIKKLKYSADRMNGRGASSFETEIKTISGIRHRNLVGIADFGLAKVFLDYQSHVSTKLRGTFGYLAPEYIRDKRITDKSDVFSFGVVLLELITGKLVEKEGNDSRNLALRVLHPPYTFLLFNTQHILTNLTLSFLSLQFGVIGNHLGWGFGCVSIADLHTGYADPEYGDIQRVSEKSDVYSFGVAKDRIGQALENNEYTDLVDSRLQEYNEEEMIKMICCAAASVYKPSRSRPIMKQIIRVLEGTIPHVKIMNWKDIELFKISDFGLAKQFSNYVTHMSTMERVTFGCYLCPEYFRTQQISDKTDVYSFGVVLLELITGKRPNSREGNFPVLTSWVAVKLIEALDTDNYDNIVDVKLENNYRKIEMIRMIYCAAACVYKPVKYRPKMS